MGFIGVAQVLVLNDDHISIADFFQGPKAQGGDGELSHNHAAAAAVKKKTYWTEEEKRRNRFQDSFE